MVIYIYCLLCLLYNPFHVLNKFFSYNMSIKNNYFDLILKYTNKYKQSKHNTKYSNRYYLTHILDVLDNVVN